jgi:hypothetical protein
MRGIGDGITAMLVLKMASGSCFPVDCLQFHMDQEVNFSISREPNDSRRHVFVHYTAAAVSS